MQIPEEKRSPQYQMRLTEKFRQQLEQPKKMVILLWQRGSNGSYVKNCASGELNRKNKLYLKRDVSAITYNRPT